MKKLIAFMMVIMMVSTMSISAAAITTGQWDFSAGQKSAQNAAGKALADYNGGFRIEMNGWRAKVITSSIYEVDDDATLTAIWVRNK